MYVRPQGAWASSPGRLILTPSLAAAVGVVVERTLGFGFLAVLLCVVLTFLLILTLDSPVSPAISASLLPLLQGEGLWSYPTAVLLGTVVLAGLSWVMRRAGSSPPSRPSGCGLLEAGNWWSRNALWALSLLGFLLIVVFLVRLTGWHFLLVPPLVVAGFEMLAFRAHCAWADRPKALVLVLTLTAGAGVLASDILGRVGWASVLTIAVGMAVLQLSRLHLPPALAVGLLPIVLGNYDWRYPIAVGGARCFSHSWLGFIVGSMSGISTRNRPSPDSRPGEDHHGPPVVKDGQGSVMGARMPKKKEDRLWPDAR